jgi:hypothetical protein
LHVEMHPCTYIYTHTCIHAYLFVRSLTQSTDTYQPLGGVDGRSRP